MCFYYLLPIWVGINILFCKVCITFFIFMQLSLSICYCFYKKYFKLNEKTQPMCIVLIIDPKSHTHPYIYKWYIMWLLNQSNVCFLKKKKKTIKCLKNYQLYYFCLIANFIIKCYYNMIIIHTHITNPLYFLIIKLYKVILYLYYTHTHSHK